MGLGQGFVIHVAGPTWAAQKYADAKDAKKDAPGTSTVMEMRPPQM